MFGLGGLGMAGALPGPIQDVVATVASPLGIDMPRSDDTPDEPKASDEQDGSTSTTGPNVSSVQAPGQTGQTPGLSGSTPADGAEPPGQSGSTGRR